MLDVTIKSASEQYKRLWQIELVNHKTELQFSLHLTEHLYYSRERVQTCKPILGIGLWEWGQNSIFFPQNTQRFLMPPICLFLHLHLLPPNGTGSAYTFQSVDSWRAGRITGDSEKELGNDLRLSSITSKKVPRGGRSRVCVDPRSRLHFTASSTLALLPSQGLQDYKELSIAKNGPTLFSILLCLRACQKICHVWWIQNIFYMRKQKNSFKYLMVSKGMLPLTRQELTLDWGVLTLWFVTF